MPLFTIRIDKRFEGYPWNNDYVVLAADIDTAVVAAAEIKTFEQKLHFNLVEFIGFKVSPIPNPTRSQHKTVAFADLGFRSVPRADYGEAKRVLYVTLNSTLGMPGRKMYRYVIGDGEYQGKGEGAFITSAAFLTLFNDAAEVLFENLGFASVALLVNRDAREVVAMVPQTVTSLQTRKEHYNRAPSAATAQAASTESTKNPPGYTGA
jgi:hypothetical protein